MAAATASGWSSIDSTYAVSPVVASLGPVLTGLIVGTDSRPARGTLDAFTFQATLTSPGDDRSRAAEPTVVGPFGFPAELSQHWGYRLRLLPANNSVH